MNDNAEVMVHPEHEHSRCPCPYCCLLPADGPPAWLRDEAAPIWCGDYFAELTAEMGNDVADECALSFAYGFEKGLVMRCSGPSGGRVCI